MRDNYAPRMQREQKKSGNGGTGRWPSKDMYTIPTMRIYIRSNAKSGPMQNMSSYKLDYNCGIERF